MTTFYNTTNETTANLREYKAKAQKQDDAILEWFRDHPFDNFPPHVICKRVFDSRVPKTSIHRSLSNLTDSGLLIKTETMVVGEYGRLQHTWRLKHTHAYQTELF